MIKIFPLFPLLAFSLCVNALEADQLPETNRWVELGVGTVNTVQYKTVTDRKGWAIAYTSYDEDGDIDFIDGDKLINRKSGVSFNESTKELAVMRTFTRNNRWGYSGISFGLGLVNSNIAENCTKISSGLFRDSYSCDKNSRKGVSVPVELDFAFGRYLGVGLKLRGSIGVVNTAGVALTIPLGKFAKY